MSDVREQRGQRHLAAFLAADMVGSSRPMERDGIPAGLEALRAEVFESRTRAHDGRIKIVAVA
jgi:hypothetical protein